MIKIAKPGQKEFHGFCKWCGCEFTYEISDLKLSATSDKVSCPTCGKDYHHPAMVQNPTIPGGIGYQWPSDSTDPCAGCTWREHLLRDGVYIGDTPCTWCNKNKFNCLTVSQPSLKDYTTPCVNQLDSYLTTSISSGSNVKAYNKTENKEDVTDGVFMQTFLNAYTNSSKADTCSCDDTEGCNSCSGEHKCDGKKNCKGKH
jgi:hypothetical protein